MEISGRLASLGAARAGRIVGGPLNAASFAVLPADSHDARSSAGYKLAGGEPDALEACYRIFGSMVRGYLSRLVPYNDVDDVSQRVFAELWRCRHRFDPTRSLSAWVLHIAHHRAVDHLRRRSDVVAPLEWADSVIGDDGRTLADQRAWAGEMRQLLDELPEEQRAPIMLAYFDGYTQSEIAKLLDIPLGTIKSRTARGLKQLARSLEALNSQPRDDPGPRTSAQGPRAA